MITIKDVLLIIGSTTTIVFAFVGYNKWKKELIGRLKYELARTILKELYSLRDSFKELRSTLILASEFPPGFNPKDNNEKESNRYIFTNRLKYFSKSYNSFLSILPEIEIEFEPELLKLIRELLSQITMYQFRLNEFIQLTGNTNNDEHYQELRRIIFNIGDDNPTTSEFMVLTEKIENKLKREIKKY